MSVILALGGWRQVDQALKANLGNEILSQTKKLNKQRDI